MIDIEYLQNVQAKQDTNKVVKHTHVVKIGVALFQLPIVGVYPTSRCPIPHPLNGYKI